jgi:hypothetical protein
VDKEEFHGKSEAVKPVMVHKDNGEKKQRIKRKKRVFGGGGGGVYSVFPKKRFCVSLAIPSLRLRHVT